MATRETTIRLTPERRRWGESAIKGVLALCALVSIATTVGIVVALTEPAIEFFREIDFIDYITGSAGLPSSSRRASGSSR